MLLAMVSVHELADLSKSHSYGIGRGGYKKVSGAMHIQQTNTIPRKTTNALCHQDEITQVVKVVFTIL